MKKRIFICLQLILTSLYSHCNLVKNYEDKTTVAILPFTAVSNVKKEDIEIIYGQVMEAFVNSKRFTIIERKNHKAIFDELEKQKNEIYNNSSKVAKQGEQLGANFLVLGDIGAGGSNGAISITLSLIDVETAEIVVTKNISNDNSKKTLGSILSTGTALSTLGRGYQSSSDVNTNTAGNTLINNLTVNTLDIVKRTTAFINSYFSLTSKIIKIEEQKGEKAEKVLVAMGEGMNLKKGQTLFVYEESVLDVGGKKLKRKQEIGQLKIEAIEGDITLCKVTDGGIVILQKGTNSNVNASTNKIK